MKTPELLCPVGGMDTLHAALLGGADAVYFGGKEFNARMNAKNFSREDILSAVSLCHQRGVRVYVTLNTLLTDRQLPAALDFAHFLYRAGCDALILADVGLAAKIHEALPDFELHASTQMSGHNTAAAVFLKEKGFSRMVCARELDRENLSVLCQNAPLEIELFVHGAICACHSGQCLMSSMIGDRSGNRGECAQPCRLPYNGGYPLSFKDLSLAEHVTEILSLGVASLKIEGRMKSPEYVYTVTRIWRRLLDERRNATSKEMELLAGIFSRSGFTDGYFTRSLSSAMLGTRTAQDKEKTAKSRPSFRDSGRSAPAILIQREEKEPLPLSLPAKTPSSFGRSARFWNPESIPETDFFREIYLPLHRFDPRKANGIVLPPVVLDSERGEVRRRLELTAKQGAVHALVGNVGHFELLKDLPFRLHGDFRLNLMNSFSADEFSFLEDVILSPELNLPQMRDLRGKKRVIVYGRLPLMLLEKSVGAKALRDRRGVVFPVGKEGGRDLIFNSVPLYMADRGNEMKEKGLTAQHFLFTTESEKQVQAVIEAWKKGLSPNGSVRRIK